MKHFIIPTKENNHTPHLLTRKALVVYTITIIAFNILLTQLGFVTVSANITADSLLSSHNSQRAANGIGSLSYNGTLAVSASNKANEMLATNCWSHYCPSGKAPWAWISEAGYSYIYAGENLAEGFSSTDAVMNAWMNSASHRANILSSNFTEVGFGFAYGSFQGNPNNVIVVVHFGQPVSSPAPAPPPQQNNANDTSVASEPVYTQPVQPQPVEEPEPSINVEHKYTDEPVNSSIIEFNGTVEPQNSEVLVKTNGEEDGRVKAKGKNFTYKSPEKLEDGSYKVNAILQGEGGKDLVSAKPFTVILDGESPTISATQNNVLVIGEETFVVNLSTSKDVTTIKSNAEYKSLREIEKGAWEIEFDKSVLGDFDKIEFEVQDSAKNKAEYALFTSIIENKFENSIFNDEVIDTSIPAKFFSNFKENDIRVIVASLFIVFMIVLFAIDFIVLAKKDMLHEIKRKSHLHFAIFLIMFIAINMTGFGGAILVGGN